ncbi:MAG: heme-binding domain-containing protein [Bacteroidales bacterium]|jgi:hypothetical protein
MKKNLLLLTAILVFFVILAFRFPEGVVTPTDQKLEIPENVQNILDNSCNHCHGKQASWWTHFRPKSKLDLGDLPNLTTADQVNKLFKIVDVVKDGEMPKQRYVKRNPNAALSEESKTILVSWAEKQADELVSD